MVTGLVSKFILNNWELIITQTAQFHGSISMNEQFTPRTDVLRREQRGSNKSRFFMLKCTSGPRTLPRGGLGWGLHVNTSPRIVKAKILAISGIQTVPNLSRRHPTQPGPMPWGGLSDPTLTLPLLRGGDRKCSLISQTKTVQKNYSLHQP